MKITPSDTIDMKVIKTIMSENKREFSYPQYLFNNGKYETCLQIKDTSDISLYFPCKNGYIEIVKLLISMGANDWNEALSVACEFGHLEIAKLLISHGANDWLHAIYSTRKSGHKELADYLVASKPKNEIIAFFC